LAKVQKVGAGKPVKKLILLAYGPTSNIEQWRIWCRQVHTDLPEDLKERRRMLKKRLPEEIAIGLLRERG
jgi:hypothetical protein